MNGTLSPAATTAPALAWIAAAALPLALYAIGRRIADWLTAPEGDEPGAGGGYRATLAVMAGSLAFYLTLLLLDAAGIPWTRVTLLIALALLWALLGKLPAAWRRRLPRRSGPLRKEALSEAGLPVGSRPGRPTFAPGWGDLAAAFALVVFALLATTLWVTLPDFYYHWGLKAERFVLAGGFDEAWLARSWNYPIHPDYPNLLPGLYAATAILGGRFAAPPLMLWSVVFFALILASAREALRRAGVEGPLLQGALALIGLTLATFGVGYRMAGGADWTIALALVAAAPPLLGNIHPATARSLGRPTALRDVFRSASGWRADLQIGLAAAFAAGCKIEGVPLAVFLILVHALRRARLGGRDLLRSLGLASLLPAAVVLPWLLQVRRWDLFQASNTAPFDSARIQPVANAMLEAVSAPELHGLPWLAVLLPLPLLARRTRSLTAVCAAQLLFYVWAYLASDLEPRFYVLSNFARLLFHLIPATLLAVAIATERPRAIPPEALHPSP